MEKSGVGTSKMCAVYPIIIAGLLLSFPGLASAQSAVPAAASRVTGITSSIPVCVFFDGRALGLEDIKSEAAKALATSGYRVGTGVQCSINVSIGDDHSGCMVFLQEPGTNWVHVVRLDRRGVAQVQRSGPARHGSPSLLKALTMGQAGTTLDGEIGKEVTLKGTAENEGLKAFVRAGNASVYLPTRAAWDSTLVGTLVKVTGTLKKSIHEETGMPIFTLSNPKVSSSTE